MPRNIFCKTLFEKRWVILAWFLAIFVTNLAIIQIFPPMKEAFSTMTASLPGSLQVWFGDDGQIWQSLKGFVSMEVMGQMAIVIVVFGVIFSSSILAGEEKSGLLLTQLARPVRRRSYFVQKYLAFVVALAIVMVGFLAGTIIGALALGESLGFVELLRGCAGVILLTLSLGSLTFALGAIFASGGLAGAVVGFYAVIGYFIVSLRGAADILTTLSQMTPFYYYNTPSLMYENFEPKNVLILLGFIIIPLLIALPIFARRDLRTR